MANGIVLDIETTSLDPISGDLLCVGFENNDGDILVRECKDNIRFPLSDFLRDSSNLVIGANLGFDLQWFIGDREIPNCRVHDVQFMHYLLDENYPIRNLKHLHLLYTNLEEYEPEVLPHELSREKLFEYNAKDVYSTRRVYEGILEELNGAGINYKPTLDLVAGVQPILAGLERTGIPIDESKLGEVSDQESEAVQQLEDCVREYLSEYGKEGLNLNSHRQLSNFIFDTLETKVPDVRGVKNKDGSFSTSKDVLSECEDETGFISALLSYKKRRDNYRKYVLNIGERVRSGRVHPSYNVYKTVYGGTSTGRLSINDPPIHNIPRGHSIRKAFVPFERQGFLVQMDLSQIELVMLAYLSRDRELINALYTGEDLHMWVVNMLAKEGVTISRQDAKTVNYAILYGASDYGVYSQTALSKPAAKYIHGAWFARFTGVKQFQERIEFETSRLGYVESPSGRRRYFPPIDYDFVTYWRKRLRVGARGFPPKRYWTYEAWLREAKNFIQQSIASDLNLVILNQTSKELHEDVFPLTLIHDSVLWSCDDGRSRNSWCDFLNDYFLSDFINDIYRILGLKIDVNLKAEVKYGKNWLELDNAFGIST